MWAFEQQKPAGMGNSMSNMFDSCINIIIYDGMFIQIMRAEIYAVLYAYI